MITGVSETVGEN